MNDFKDQRLNSFIENYLDKYDVICLQEMFGAFSRRRRKLIKAARRRGFYWKVSSPQSRSSLYLVDGGCLILSKVKICAEASVIFPPGMMADRLAAKGVVYAKLNPKPGVFVHLFTTHLQATYSTSDTVAECLAVQKEQYDHLVDFVATTVAANESHTDMLVAKRLLEKKRRQVPVGKQLLAPEQDTMEFLSQKCRRWPIVITGDFNCNSRPTPGDIENQTTQQYMDLRMALSKLGNFSDVLYDNLGEHPVTYAQADFDVDGSFSPRETALTHPDDYHDSGEFVNQSLDYIFVFPPTHEDVKLATGVVSSHTSPEARPVLASPQADHEGLRSPMSPDSRALKGSLVRPVDLHVRHLDYLPGRDPRAPPGGVLRYLSDHLAVESVLDIASEY